MRIDFSVRGRETQSSAAIRKDSVLIVSARIAVDIQTAQLPESCCERQMP